MTTLMLMWHLAMANPTFQHHVALGKALSCPMWNKTPSQLSSSQHYSPDVWRGGSHETFNPPDHKNADYWRGYVDGARAGEYEMLAKWGEALYGCKATDCECWRKEKLPCLGKAKP